MRIFGICSSILSYYRKKRDEKVFLRKYMADGDGKRSFYLLKRAHAGK
jgi:hypothetical protein